MGLITLIAGLGAATFYNGNQTADLRDRFATTESALIVAETRISELQAEQTDQAGTLEALGSTEAIASSVLSVRYDDMINAIVSELMTNPDTVERLTGPVGPAPDVEQLTSDLLDRGLAEMIGLRIWEERYEELATMPAVIAEVADVVYRRYGNELKGSDGQSVSAVDVARALASDTEFAAFLEFSKN